MLLGGSPAMRILTLPAVLVGVFAVPGSDEPSAAEMRSAVQATLTAQVQSVLDYVAETGGEGALARVRAARTDAFDIRSFTKLDCTTSADKPGHLCDHARALLRRPARPRVRQRGSRGNRCGAGLIGSPDRAQRNPGGSAPHFASLTRATRYDAEAAFSPVIHLRNAAAQVLSSAQTLTNESNRL